MTRHRAAQFRENYGVCHSPFARMTCSMPHRSFVILMCMLVALCAGGCSAQSEPPTGGAPHGVAATVRTATFSSAVRLTPTVDVTTGGRVASLMAARGEREGFQLVAWADRGSPRLVLVTHGLQGAAGTRIDARHVHAMIEQPVVVDRGSPAGRSGTYLDALVPAARRDVVLGPQQRLCAWVDVYVPLGTAPGRYSGTVELRTSSRQGRYATGSEGLLAQVPVTLVVRAATLPRRPTLGSSIGVDANQIARLEQVATGSKQLRTTIDTYAKVLAEARLSIADVSALPPTGVAGASGSADDSAYLQRLFNRRGVASVRIPFYATYPFAHPLDADRAAAIRYLRGAAAWARKHGMLDRAYVYVIDEPDVSRAGEVRELYELVHAADPALKLLVTREFGSRPFRGSVDIWTPNISRTTFRAADVAAAARAGQSTWWYPSITTWQPLPTMFIDDVRPSPRALGWLAWRYHVKGILYWTATHWQEVDDPYRQPATFHTSDSVGNGDGLLLYPGATVGHAGHPSRSVRLLELRDGIDDHDLLTLASCAGTAIDRAKLQRVTALVAPSMTSVAPSPAAVQALRATAFDVLTRAARKHRYQPESTADACSNA
ncbi:MAG: uncharacterized protein JWN41_1065 [Thermoleophilia bacterium]|nr:uncharacterized protein [Thermoleophilia bacterium]